MNNWDEIRTAYQVARAGTVSGAAQVLGVHHATVIRHIDALESHMGVRLFQRHARGYTPTEAGADLLRVAQATDDQFCQLASRIRGQGDTVTGELVVTSLAGYSHVLTPILVRFQRLHPEVSVRYLTGSRLFRLEYGEAHVAIRAGSPPTQPDNVVQVFQKICIALYGSKEYLAINGTPANVAELSSHRFVSYDEPQSRAPYHRWLKDNITQDQVTFRVADDPSMQQAILAGAGLGFMGEKRAEHHPELVRVLPSRPDWEVPLWLVTHVDLHRTAKVQTFLKFLKSEMATGS
ncbi:MAG TPA: LysR family transcriptional regulator [Rhodobacteraceae bacterium]|jgi:DNA-binding transcriptional LysR family regulator|nr:LysR family transcriptional regulator [Paracoccaceae bacterium]